MNRRGDGRGSNSSRTITLPQGVPAVFTIPNACGIKLKCATVEQSIGLNLSCRFVDIIGLYFEEILKHTKYKISQKNRKSFEEHYASSILLEALLLQYHCTNTHFQTHTYQLYL